MSGSYNIFFRNLLHLNVNYQYQDSKIYLTYFNPPANLPSVATNILPPEVEESDENEEWMEENCRCCNFAITAAIIQEKKDAKEEPRSPVTLIA